MIKNRIIYLFTIMAFCQANSPNFLGEVLHYSAGFRYFAAGNATLSMQADSLDDEMTYLLTYTIKTNSFLSNFYKIKDKIYSWLSPDDLSLRKTIHSIREGHYKINHEAIINGDSLTISGKNAIKLSEKIHDPVSYVYFLRMKKLSIGDRYRFNSYGRKKIKEIIIDVTGKENIKVPAGTFNCFKIEPVTEDGKPILKNKGEMQVWLSDDSLHLPVKIVQNTNVGMMILNLKTISH